MRVMTMVTAACADGRGDPGLSRSCAARVGTARAHACSPRRCSWPVWSSAGSCPPSSSARSACCGSSRPGTGSTARRRGSAPPPVSPRTASQRHRQPGHLRQPGQPGYPASEPRAYPGVSATDARGRRRVGRGGRPGPARATGPVPADAPEPPPPGDPTALIWACALAWSGCGGRLRGDAGQRSGGPGRPGLLIDELYRQQPDLALDGHHGDDPAVDGAAHRCVVVVALVRGRLGARRLRLARATVGPDRAAGLGEQRLGPLPARGARQPGDAGAAGRVRGRRSRCCCGSEVRAFARASRARRILSCAGRRASPRRGPRRRCGSVLS